MQSILQATGTPRKEECTTKKLKGKKKQCLVDRTSRILTKHVWAQLESISVKSSDGIWFCSVSRVLQSVRNKRTEISVPSTTTLIWCLLMHIHMYIHMYIYLLICCYIFMFYNTNTVWYMLTRAQSRHRVLRYLFHSLNAFFFLYCTSCHFSC